MKNNPKISVIVPVYKVESVLSECLDSILDQSYSDFELLLIDDGSPDKSGFVCDQYALKDNRIRVFHQENQGVSTARNRGLKEAKGDYLVFVDSDDWVDRDFFLTISAYFDQYDLIVFGLKSISVDGDVLLEQKPESMNTCTNALSDILYSLFSLGLLGYMCSIAIKQRIIEDNQIVFRQDLSIHEDSLFCYACLRYVQSLITLDYLPYMYVIYAEERQTLSNSLPINYYDIAVERIHEMKKLQELVRMPLDQRLYIIDTLKYWACIRCLDQAYRQSDCINSFRSCFSQLSAIADFRPVGLRGHLYKLILKTKNPYFMLLCKRIMDIL